MQHKIPICHFRKIVNDSKRKNLGLPAEPPRKAMKNAKIKSHNSAKPHKQDNEQTDKVKANKRKHNSNVDKHEDTSKAKKRKFDPSSAQAIQLKYKAKFSGDRRQKKKFGQKGKKKGAPNVQSES